MSNVAVARSRFWDRIADKYSRRPVADEAAYQHKLEVTRKHLRPDMRVLEFGCGTGSTAIVHAPRVEHIRAIDISEKMIEIARGKAEAASVDNLTFEQATIEEIEEDETYDVVFGLSILHLVADREAVVAKVFRMLAPGGLFVTSTTCLADLRSSWLLRGVLPIGRFFGRMPLVRFFTTEALLAGFTDAGFDIDYQWRPGPGKALFVVARKPAGSPAARD